VAKLKDRRAVDALMHFALLPRDCVSTAKAIAALKDITGTEAINALAAALQTGDDPQVRIAAAQILGKLKDPRSVPPLLAALNDEGDIRGGAKAKGYTLSNCGIYRDPRDSAANSLCELAAYGGLKVLLSGMESQNPDTRRWAARALQDAGCRTAKDALARGLARKDAAITAGAFASALASKMPHEVLGQALELYGTREMATYLVNSSDPALRGMGTDWGDKHGMWVVRKRLSSY
jgi:HEAT repeat protein